VYIFFWATLYVTKVYRCGELHTPAPGSHWMGGQVGFRAGQCGEPRNLLSLAQTESQVEGHATHCLAQGERTI